MKYLFFSLFTIIFFIACTVGPKTTSHNTMKPDSAEDINMENLKHGWKSHDKKKTKTYASDSDSVARGKLLYQHHCQQCHGDNGKGDGPLGQTLKLKPSDLTNISEKLPNSYLVVRINKGKGSMPQWDPLLTNKQTWDLTQYILHIATRR